MKTLTLTMLQAVRVALMLDNHQGQRKDLKIVSDIRERLGISDDDIQSLITPIQGGFTISGAIRDMPDIEITLAPAEARKLLEILDSQTMSTRDLAWADPLAKNVENLK